MDVIFHIAARSDWEHAVGCGTYATGSVRREGFIHCSTADRHAAVANRLFAGRTDLVLLLIDTDRLASEVRFEQADAASEAFPHVYGTVNLDAVFEAAAPYRPGADGRFQPHEEASGFAAHGAATLDQAGRRAMEAMAGYPGRWWVAGGWALDLALGRRTRPHADLEVSVLAADQQALFEHLRGWDLRAACHSCARRSRCCSRPKHLGSRISETSTASSHTLTGPPAAGWPRPLEQAQP